MNNGTSIKDIICSNNLQVKGGNLSADPHVRSVSKYLLLSDSASMLDVSF